MAGWIGVKQQTVWMSFVILAVGASSWGCGGDNTALEPLDLAFLLAEDFSVTGSQTIGRTDTFVSFNVNRERDNVAITEPINVLIRPQEASEPETLTDVQGNQVFTQRAVVLLGNGPDANSDGTPEPPPTSPPQTLGPSLVPYTAPAGWNARATLGYVPNQSTIPGRPGSNQFGVYVSSLVAFEGRLQFIVQDQLNQVFSRSTTLTYATADVQPVTVTNNGFVASSAEPIVITVCNQINAALHVGLTTSNSSTVSIPTLQAQPDSSLNASTAYVAEAYQFNSSGTVLRVSSNPTNPDQLSVPLLNSTETTGAVTLTLNSVTEPTNRFTCAGDLVDDLDTILSGFF